MVIEVNPELCTGQARCAAVAGAIYVLDQEGYNHMGRFTVASGCEADARRGARACPERAISIVQE